MRSGTPVLAILWLATSACNDAPTSVTDVHSDSKISAPHADLTIANAPPAIVPAFLCSVIFGGTMTVPAGSEVVIAQRWTAKTMGLVQQFLNAQTTTIVVNAGAPTDVSDRYDPIASTAGGAYSTRVLQPTGVTVGTGESMTFSLVLEFSHQLHDGYTFEDGDSHKKLIFGPGVAAEFPCTVIGT